MKQAIFPALTYDAARQTGAGCLSLAAIEIKLCETQVNAAAANVLRFR